MKLRGGTEQEDDIPTTPAMKIAARKAIVQPRPSRRSKRPFPLIWISTAAPSRSRCSAPRSCFKPT